MTTERTDHNRDPYAPPPRHKERSGPILRVVILAGLLAAAAWGYMAFSQGPGLMADSAPEAQVMADTAYDTPLSAVPSDDAPATAEDLDEPAA